MPPKTTCPISRADFLAKAQPLTIDINGFALTADPREFSTGSFGWYVNSKAPVTIDGKTVQVQVGMNLIVVGSKDVPKAAPKEVAQEAEAAPEAAPEAAKDSDEG